MPKHKPSASSRRAPLQEISPNENIPSQSARKRRGRRIIESSDDDDDTSQTLTSTQNVPGIEVKTASTEVTGSLYDDYELSDSERDAIREAIEAEDELEKLVDNIAALDRSETDVGDQDGEDEADENFDGLPSGTRPWVERLRQNAIEPPRDISPYLANGPITCSKEDTDRFRARCHIIITAMKEWADAQNDQIDHVEQLGTNWKDRAMTRGCQQLLRKYDVQDIKKAFLDSVPEPVKSLLGRENLSPTDLLQLPVIDDSLKVWGVYVDIAKGPHGVEGVYVGSSVAYQRNIGMAGRIKIHQRNSEKSIEKIHKDHRSAHYSLICRPDITPDFRALAFFKVAFFNCVATPIAEQVIMLYLGTIRTSSSIQQSFVEMVRSNIPDLPDLSALGLNRALPLAQGGHLMPSNKGLHQAWLKEKGKKDECQNCGRPAPLEQEGKRSWWLGWFEARRCMVCYAYRWKHGNEKPRDLITDREMHQVWLDRGHDNVCQNPACLEPRREDHNAFFGLGPDSRCNPCQTYRNKHGVDAPNPRFGKTAANHGAWLEEGNADVCGICHAPRPADSHLVGWRGWRDASRCASCAVERRKSESDDEAWVEIYGDICAICGVDRAFVNSLTGRCDYRRYGSCLTFRFKNRREKNQEELDRGTVFLHAEWVSQGNPDVCQQCGEQRGNYKFYGYRENSLCRSCYARKRTQLHGKAASDNSNEPPASAKM